ncbi:MAG: hypothetical protein ACC661_09175, partial [Verrucomicrobiales bacterium]
MKKQPINPFTRISTNPPPAPWALVALATLALWLAPRLSAGEIEITILHTNDIHQHIEPLPRIAGYVAAHKADHPHTVFVDAG